jgi:hypothetical protein
MTSAKTICHYHDTLVSFKLLNMRQEEVQSHQFECKDFYP